MPARLRYLLYLANASFWFVPGIITAAATGAALLVLEFDRASAAPLTTFLPSLDRIEPEGARQVLATIAGSLITVTSLVFSMTLVILTVASSQLGPRLLKIFMRDRINQVTLGTFTGTFLFALLVLSAVREGPPPFVPELAIVLVLVLIIANVGLLIYFVHHIADSIQADTVIAYVGDELDATIDELFHLAPESRESPPPKVPPDAAVVTAGADGYVQAVDHTRLIQIAADADIVIRLGRRAGDAVIRNGNLAAAWPKERITPALCRRIGDAVAIGATRTPTQDVNFSIMALVEIGLRALSSGINDPYTAIAAIDRLTAGLARALHGRPPPAVRADDKGMIRLTAPAVTFDTLLHAAFAPIRQHADGNVPVVLRLIESLARLAEQAQHADDRRALRQQGTALAATCRRSVPSVADRREIAGQLRRLRIALRASGKRER